MGNSKTAKTRRLFMYRQYESNDVLYFYTVPVKLPGWAQAAGSYTPCYQHLHHGWSDGCWRHRRRDDGCLLLEPDTCNLVFSNAQTISSILHINRNSGGPHTFYLFIFSLRNFVMKSDEQSRWPSYMISLRATNSTSMLYHTYIRPASGSPTCYQESLSITILFPWNRFGNK